MKYYATLENFPVKSNCPQPGWTEKPKNWYDQRCIELNTKHETEQAKLEEQIKLKIKEEKRIQEKLREIVLKEL